MRKLLIALPLLSILISGCTTVTNLTPSVHTRNSTGLYPVEFVWETRQQSVRPTSIQPSVLVETESYPMQSTPLMTNRWEALVPVPENEKSLRYRIKVDYEYGTIHGIKKNSRLSEEYRLELKDKK